MNSKHILITGLILLFAFQSPVLQAQKKSKDNGLKQQLDNVRARDLRNFGSIIENEITVGYYMFSKLEKTGGGMAMYQIEIFDENLKSKKTIKLERSKTAQLVEMNYNGAAFFLMMTNKKGVDMVTYNKEGKKLGEINIKKVNKYERMRISQALQSQESSNASVYSSNDQGFIRQTFVKNKKLGYSVEAYSNDLKLIWKYSSDAASPKIEGVDIMYASAKYVTLLRSEKKNMTTKDVDNHVIMLDAESGDKLFEIPMKEISDLSVLGCHVDEDKKEVIFNGEYFGKGKNIYKAKSEGLYMMKVDMSGKELKMEKMSWKTDLLSLTVKDEEKGKSNDNMRFYIHKVFTAANGNTYIVAEQYKKIVSASAVAMNALSAMAGGGGNSNLSNISIKIYNIVYMVLDPDFKLIDKQVVKKKYSEFYLEKGYEFVSATLLAHYIKANGWFDYQFSTRNADKTGFTAYYIDLNRKGADGKKNDAVIGTISLLGESVETKRTPFNTEFSRVFINPAKEGNILIGEFWRSKSRLMLRIEPMQ